jgi:hypothetical protein
MRRFLAIAATMLAARTAAADVVIAADPTSATPPRATSGPERRLDARVGFMLGGSDVADANGRSLGFHGQLGYRIDGVTLFGELDYYSVGDSPGEMDRRTGRTTRLGVTARYSLLRTPHSSGSLGGDWWIEAGGGYEYVNWDAGGVLRRPDVALGVGLELDARPRWSPTSTHHAGWYVAFRSVLARAPESDAPVVCGGPCTQATQPSRTDVSLYFLVGLHWGR